MKALRTAVNTALVAIILSGTALAADPCARCESAYRSGMDLCGHESGASSRDYCERQVERAYRKCKKDNDCKGKKKKDGAGNKLYLPSGNIWN